MSNSTRNGSNGLIIGLLVFLFVGNYFQLEQIFLNLAFLGMIGLNTILIITNFRSTSRQMSYYFSWVLFVGIFYAIIKFYMNASWAWIVATAFIGFNILASLGIRDRPPWDVKIVRDGLSLVMIIFEHNSLTSLLVLTISFAVFLLFEEFHQLYANKMPKTYGESEKLYYTLSWFYGIGMLFGIYLAERNPVVQILLLSYCGVFFLKLILLNTKTQVLEFWPWITAIYLGINLTITALYPEFIMFLKLFIPLSIWIVGSFLLENFAEASNTSQRNVRFGILSAWAVGNAIILHAYLFEVLVVYSIIFYVMYLMEQNRTVKILYSLFLNTILIGLALPYAVQNVPYYDYLEWGYSVGDWGIILLIVIDGLILIGFFSQFIKNTTSISNRDSFIVSLCMKAALTGLLWGYLEYYVIFYELAQLYLEIQLGLAFILLVVSLLFNLRNDAIRDLGFYIQIYAAVLGIISLFVLRMIHPFYTNIYYALGFGGFFVLSAWIMNGHSPKNYQTIKESTQEVFTLLFAGCAVITLWFVLIPEFTLQTLLMTYGGLVLGLRTLHRNKLMCALYTFVAQVLWLIIIAMEWISGTIFGVMLTVGIGFGIFFITDLFNLSHTRQLTFFMWIIAVFIPVMSYATMESYSEWWYIMTPAILAFTILYFKIEASWLGGLNSFKTLKRMWVLLLAPAVALTYYYATYRGWLVLSSDLSYVAWIVYIGALVMELTLLFVFRSNVQSRDLLKMVDQKIQQEEKKQKSVKSAAA